MFFVTMYKQREDDEKMKHKKLFAILTLVCFMFTLMPVAAMAEDNVAIDDKGVYFSSLAEALASTTGSTITLLKDAEYSYGARTELGLNGDITIDGANYTLNLKGTDTDWSSIGNANGKLTFKNMTINKTEPGNGAWNNHAINFTTEVAFENVTVNNSVAVGANASFTNVNFVENGEYYTLWIKNNVEKVTVDECTFTAENNGRGIKIADQYVDEAEQTKVKLEVTNSTFKTAKKAAILVTSSKGADITASGNNIAGVAADNAHLVWLDEGEAYVNSFAEVTVKDEQGEPVAGALTIEGITDPVATVNDVPYATLQDALNVADSGDTIELLKDATIEAAVAGQDTDLKGVKINGNEKTLTVTGTGGGLANVNLIDVTIVDETCYTYENGENAWEFTYLEFSGENTFKNVAFTDGIMFDGTNTITDCSFSGHNNDSSDKGNGAMYGAWVNSGTAIFTNCEFAGTRGLKIHEAYGSDVAAVTVDGCTFNSLTEKPGIAIGNLNEVTEVTVKDSEFIDCQAGDQEKYLYESDTDVATFVFDNENDNRIIIGDDEYIFKDNALVALYTVTFDSAEGTAVEAQVVENGEKVVEPVAPTRSGFTFAGWYNGDVAYDFDTPVESDLVLTAKWNKNVTYYGGGASASVSIVSDDNATVKVSDKYADKGETVTITVDAKDSFYAKDVVVTDKNGEAITVTRVALDKWEFTMPSGKVKVDVDTAEYSNEVVLQIGDLDIAVNDAVIQSDVAPFIKNDRTMVPISVIVYALGGTTDWDGETRTVTVTLDGKVLTMVIDEIIPGFGAAAIIVDSRTYVPIGYVADVLGCDVDWIAATRQVVIVK